MKTTHKVLLISSIFWVLAGAVLLDIQSNKNEKQMDNLESEVESLNHQITVLKDSISIMEMDMMTNKIDLGRYEVAIDYLEGDCKTKMDEILSHIE